jgi:RHS repeat-associated protein
MRLSAVRGGVLTRYLYDPWGNCMAETDGSNRITRAYAYGLGLSAMVGSDGSIYCYHFDALGSVIALTDMDQTIVNAYAYDPFGRLREQESLAQPFKYVGRYGVMHEPNGLYYMRARYYDPSVGRFISEDPIGFAGGDVNLYGYVHNDPVNLVDPLGLAPSPISPEIRAAIESAMHDAEEEYSRLQETQRAILDVALLLVPELGGAKLTIRIGPHWRPRPLVRSGCEDIARQIQRHIGGTIHTITPKKGMPSLGGFRGQSPGWASHDVVVREGRVYDASTGHKGLPIDEYKLLWEYPDVIDFGF